MAGKTRPISQIKQLIRLHQNGYGIKTIARTLGISKNTVKAYLKKIKEGELDTTALLAQDDPVVEKTFMRVILLTRTIISNTSSQGLLISKTSWEERVWTERSCGMSISKRNLAATAILSFASILVSNLLPVKAAW